MIQDWRHQVWWEYDSLQYTLSYKPPSSSEGPSCEPGFMCMWITSGQSIWQSYPWSFQGLVTLKNFAFFYKYGCASLCKSKIYKNDTRIKLINLSHLCHKSYDSNIQSSERYFHWNMLSQSQDRAYFDSYNSYCNFMILTPGHLHGTVTDVRELKIIRFSQGLIATCLG